MNEYIIAKELKEKGLVYFEEQFYVRCVNHEDKDILYVPDYQRECDGIILSETADEFAHDEYYCPECNRRIFPRSKHKFKRYKTKLDWFGTINWVLNKFQTDDVALSQTEKGLLKVEFKNNSIFICFPQQCRNNGILWSAFNYDDPVIFVYSVVPQLPADFIDLTMTIDLPELLESNQEAIKNILENSISKYSTQVNKMKFEKEFDAHVQSLTDTKFEHFCIEILNYWVSHHEKVKKYIAYLRRYQNSVHGKYFVQAGGAGLPDGYSFTKLNYLKALFEGKYSEAQVEAKKYDKNTTVSLNDFQKLTAHARNRPGILFTTTNKISGTVWNDIIAWQKDEGWYKYIIIDRELFLELMIQTGAFELFSKTSGKPSIKIVKSELLKKY